MRLLIVFCESTPAASNRFLAQRKKSSCSSSDADTVCQDGERVPGPLSHLLEAPRGCGSTGHALYVPTDAGSTAAGAKKFIPAPMLTLSNMARSQGHSFIVYLVLVLVFTCRHHILKTRTSPQSSPSIYKCQNIIRTYAPMLALTRVVFRH
jgi:hypothetical protein